MPSSRIFLTRYGTQVSCMQEDFLLSELPAPNKWVLTIQVMHDASFCFLQQWVFLQLTYQSYFYLPECYLECKFSLKDRHYHKRNFYLE